MAKLTQKQIDQRSGSARTFWRNVLKQPDGIWLWTGRKNNNHNTTDGKSYDYGEFDLVTDETQNDAKPKRRINTPMAHRIAIYLTFGVEVPRTHDVFPANGNHLDVNPDNLWVRNVKTRQELPAAVFCAANDNSVMKAKAVA